MNNPIDSRIAVTCLCICLALAWGCTKDENAARPNDTTARPNDTAPQTPDSPEIGAARVQPKKDPATEQPAKLPPRKIVPMDWDKAEAIALEYYKSKRGRPPTKMTRHQGLPYYFEIPGPISVLVHNGEAVIQRGMPALERYVAESELLTARTMKGADMATLVRFLRALPPITAKGVSSSSFYNADQHAALAPAMEWRDDTALFHLHYVLPKIGGPTEHANERQVETWTLTVAKGKPLTWTSQARRFDMQTGAFFDQ